MMHIGSSRRGASRATDDLLDEGMLTVNEAAELLNLSRSKVYQLLAAGRLTSQKIDRTRRIPKRALLDFMRAHLQGGEHDPRSNP